MAFVEDHLEIGLLVDQRASVRALRQRIARDRLDHCQQDHPGTCDLRQPCSRQTTIDDVRRKTDTQRERRGQNKSSAKSYAAFINQRQPRQI